MRVLVTGGGTGGHIYPGLTIAKAIQGRDPHAELLFVGSNRGLEGDLVPREGFRLLKIELQAFQRRLSLDTARTAWKAWRGLSESRSIIKAFNPDVVVGTGGYVCGPVVLTAHWLGYPTLVQEQNALPGWTNRALGRFVDAVCIGYDEAARFFPSRKVHKTGNPIRPEILAAERSRGLARFGLSAGRPTVLVFGASQGARAINAAVTACWRGLIELSGAQVLFAVGKVGFPDVAAQLLAQGAREVEPDHVRIGDLHVFPYIYDMPEALAVADLAVCRAGAMSLAEMCAKGVPMILVPLPSAAENHQEKNARALAGLGAARMILERDLSGETLLRAVTEIIGSPDRLSTMRRSALAAGRPRAVDDIVEVVLGLARNN